MIVIGALTAFGCGAYYLHRRIRNNVEIRLRDEMITKTEALIKESNTENQEAAAAKIALENFKNNGSIGLYLEEGGKILNSVVKLMMDMIQECGIKIKNDMETLAYRLKFLMSKAISDSRYATLEAKNNILKRLSDDISAEMTENFQIGDELLDCIGELISIWANTLVECVKAIWSCDTVKVALIAAICCIVIKATYPILELLCQLFSKKCIAFDKALDEAVFRFLKDITNAPVCEKLIACVRPGWKSLNTTISNLQNYIATLYEKFLSILGANV